MEIRLINRGKTKEIFVHHKHIPVGPVFYESDTLELINTLTNEKSLVVRKNLSDTVYSFMLTSNSKVILLPKSLGSSPISHCTYFRNDSMIYVTPRNRKEFKQMKKNKTLSVKRFGIFPWQFNHYLN